MILQNYPFFKYKYSGVLIKEKLKRRSSKSPTGGASVI